MATTDELFARAWQYHQAGDLARAEEAYRELLGAAPDHADAWCFLGAVRQTQGDLAEAVAAFRRAVRLHPDYATALNCLGIALAQQGHLEDAAAQLGQAARVQPDNPEFHNNLGVVRRRQGQPAEAEAHFRTALRLRPGFPDALNNLGQILQAQGRLDEAAAHLRNSLATQPNSAEAWNELAMTLARQGQPGEAVAAFNRAVQLQPRYAEAHYNLACVLGTQGRFEDAVAHYRQATACRPNFAEAYHNCGNALRHLGRPAEALTCYQHALQQRPHSAQQHHALASVLAELGQNAAALAAYRQALALNADFAECHYSLGRLLKTLAQPEDAAASFRQALRCKPDYAAAHNSLGGVLDDLGRQAEALACFSEALRLQPDLAEAHNNLGILLADQGSYAEALASFDQAVRLQPDNADAHTNRALLWLVQGDFARGWPEYAWRWRRPSMPARSFLWPRWDGTPLAGKLIYLYGEQGLGDTVQFLRYATVVQRRGGRVVVECQPALARLAATCPGVERVVAAGTPPPVVVVQAALLDLPALLGTTAESVPAEVPYLTPDPDLVEHWRRRLADEGGIKIGIAWQGSRTYRADRWRSIPLAEFAPLAAVPGVRLFSLQKGAGTEQLAGVGFPVTDLGPGLDEAAGPFQDTAAILKNLDLVITCDSVLGHLAGALGVRVWVALPAVPDWRWMLDRDDSPWYPTVRLFRQTTLGDWGPVFRRMAAELAGQPAPAEPARPAPVTTDVVTLEVGAGGSLAVPAEFQPFNRQKPCRYGTLLYNVHDLYIGRSLDLYGEYSESEATIFRRVLRPGAVAVEVGANLGAHTVLLARLVGPSGRVLAFEPQRVVFQTLCANVALNHLTNVDCRHAAAGRAPGELFVPAIDYHRDNNYGGVGLGEYREGERVPVVTLDGFALAECALLKVDVEGMEADVLAGATATIARCRPLLYVENDRAEKSAALVRLITELGYDLFWHHAPLFNPDNFAGNPDNVFGNVVSFNMICCPRGGAFRVSGFPPVEIPTTP
jgi:FkbM family methyltransferase